MSLKISDKARRVIETVAPTLGAALGGPLGAAAGNMIAVAVGAKRADGSVDTGKVEQALAQQDPAVLLKLREAQNQFDLDMERLGVERERLVYTDRSDARSLAKTDMRPQIWISILFLGGYFMLLILLMTGDIQLEGVAKDQFGVLMGVLTAGVTVIMAFWFGSTSGSAVKSALLANSTPVPAPSGQRTQG